MEHYVTIFDSTFAPQGLALHASLERHAGDHVLWVICMDEAVQSLVEAVALPHLRAIPVADVEDDRLRSARETRTRAEYCWTLTPFSFDAVFRRDATVSRVTYVDADVWLAADPSPAFSVFEASGAGVQITEHAYAPDHDATASSGRYCVQFLTMTRDSSRPVRELWQEQCVDWCFARVEDGKFGDQKYLERWPLLFGELVHVASPRGWFQGPWNATRFPYSEAITYHFHGLRLVNAATAIIGHPTYRIPRPHRNGLYVPYSRDLAGAIATIRLKQGSVGFAQTSLPSAQRGITNRILNRINDALRRQERGAEIPEVIDLPET